MSELRTLFADIMYHDNVLSLKNKKETYVNRAIEIKNSVELKTDWHCNTYNTIATANLLEDPIFSDIIKVTSQKVIGFSGEYGIDAKSVKCLEAWINVAEPNNFQEFHIHPASHFSAVYYIDVPKDSGHFIFKSHETNTDMFPLPPTTIDSIPARRVYNFYPDDSDLIIFRSNLQHMVQINNSDKNRITFAMNFTVSV